jgi:ferritin-like metal-binding protein YciE
MTAKEMLLSWLKDAHAMEEGLIPNLEKHAKDAKEYPQIQARIQQHIGETRRHADLVRGCIERLGSDTSKTKELLGKLQGTMGGVGTAVFGDELVKDLLADYSAEHVEIASYEALIAAARDLGDETTATTCEQILRDEEAMARDIEANLPTVVRDTLHAHAAGR